MTHGIEKLEGLLDGAAASKEGDDQSDHSDHNQKNHRCEWNFIKGLADVLLAETGQQDAARRDHHNTEDL